jgi:predicted acyltransferase
MDSIYIDKSSEVREIYKAAEKSTTDKAKERLSSLDFFRGLVMVALMIGETGFFLKLYQAAPDSFTQLLSIQFEHSDWHGLTFWDTVLPAFMTMAGVAMALSYKKQQQLGYSKKHSFLKVLRRSFWLLFWGILIYSVRDQHLNWQLSNVLTQLAFTTLIAFSIINQPIWVQLATSVLCLLIPEILFRVIQIPGYDQPFVEFQNFGTFY